MPSDAKRNLFAWGRLVYRFSLTYAVSSGTLDDMKTTAAERREANKAHAAKMSELHAEAQRVVATGACPDCGAGLHRNTSLAGWYQCDRSGSGHFRRDLTGAHCNFQTFTE